MEQAVVAAVEALQGEATPQTVLRGRCDGGDANVDGDVLEVEQFGFPEPRDLTGALRATERALADAGLGPAEDEGYAPKPLLLMEPADGSWTLLVSRAGSGGLVVNAQAVVAEDSAPRALRPPQACGG